MTRRRDATRKSLADGLAEYMETTATREVFVGHTSLRDLRTKRAREEDQYRLINGRMQSNTLASHLSGSGVLTGNKAGQFIQWHEEI